MRDARSPDAPALWERYRFYVAGAVPPSHEEWARQRFPSGRWLALNLASWFGWTALGLCLLLLFAPTQLILILLGIQAFRIVWGVGRCRRRAWRGLAEGSPRDGGSNGGPELTV